MSTRFSHPVWSSDLLPRALSYPDSPDDLLAPLLNSGDPQPEEFVDKFFIEVDTGAQGCDI